MDVAYSKKSPRPVQNCTLRHTALSHGQPWNKEHDRANPCPRLPAIGSNDNLNHQDSAHMVVFGRFSGAVGVDVRKRRGKVEARAVGPDDNRTKVPIDVLTTPASRRPE